MKDWYWTLGLRCHQNSARMKSCWGWSESEYLKDFSNSNPLHHSIRQCKRNSLIWTTGTKLSGSSMNQWKSRKKSKKSCNSYLTNSRTIAILKRKSLRRSAKNYLRTSIGFMTSYRDLFSGTKTSTKTKLFGEKPGCESFSCKLRQIFYSWISPSSF